MKSHPVIVATRPLSYNAQGTYVDAKAGDELPYGEHAMTLVALGVAAYADQPADVDTSEMLVDVDPSPTIALGPVSELSGVPAVATDEPPAETTDAPGILTESAVPASTTRRPRQNKEQ